MRDLTKPEIACCAKAAGCGDKIDDIEVMRISDPLVWLGHLWDELDKILENIDFPTAKNWTHLDFSGRIVFPDATKGCRVTAGIKADHPCLALAATIEHYKANLDVPVG